VECVLRFVSKTEQKLFNIKTVRQGYNDFDGSAGQI
jgi:hypothetical protein